MSRPGPGGLGVWAVAVALAVATCCAGLAQEEGTGYGHQRRALEGWYTAEQAERGAEAYAAHCARCHGVELGGVVGVSPPLAGPVFLQRWSGDDVRMLFHYVRATMPLDAPSTLSDDTYADILAHVLHRNDLPVGSAELRPDAAQLGRMVFPVPEARPDPVEEE